MISLESFFELLPESFNLKSSDSLSAAVFVAPNLIVDLIALSKNFGGTLKIVGKIV